MANDTMKKIIPLVLLALLVYFLYYMWNKNEDGSLGANSGGNGSNGNSTTTGTTGGETPTGMISCDRCVNGYQQSYMHNGTTCPPDSIESGTGDPCNLPDGNSITNTCPDGAWGIYDEGVHGGDPTGHGVCGSTLRVAAGIDGDIPAGVTDVTPEPIGVDPQNPNIVPSIYLTHTANNEPTNVTQPWSNTTLTIGTCNDPLNSNSTFISILTGSPMSPTGIMQFLDNMRTGFNKFPTQARGCKFLENRKKLHMKHLASPPQSASYVGAPNHRAIKQAKVDFLTATINNCCVSNSGKTPTKNLLNKIK
jgi:hypothetical protein